MKTFVVAIGFAVLAGAGIAVRENLRRRLAFVTVVEWADGRRGWRYGLADKIAGPFGTIGSNNYPAPRNRVLTQFGQERGILQSDQEAISKNRL